MGGGGGGESRCWFCKATGISEAGGSAQRDGGESRCWFCKATCTSDQMTRSGGGQCTAGTRAVGLTGFGEGSARCGVVKGETKLGASYGF